MNYPPLVENLNKLVQRIRDNNTITAVTDGSYLDDKRASVGWGFYAPISDDNDGRVVPGATILFGSTILVDGHFDLNSLYQAEAVGGLTATILLYLLQLHIEHQQQLVTSFICDNKGLVKCIIKYYDINAAHITPDVTEANIILLMNHFSQPFKYKLERY